MRLLAPVRWPSAIYCAGANYADHAAEMGRLQGRPPEPDPHTLGLKPWHFIKAGRSTLAGPDDTALAPWATQTVRSFHPDVVVDAAEKAAAAPLRRHEDAATRALRSVLELHGLDPTRATANVVRADDALKVVLQPNVPELSQPVREAASIRALAAVRATDPFAARIGIKY